MRLDIMSEKIAEKIKYKSEWVLRIHKVTHYPHAGCPKQQQNQRLRLSINSFLFSFSSSLSVPLVDRLRAHGTSQAAHARPLRPEHASCCAAPMI